MVFDALWRVGQSLAPRARAVLQWTSFALAAVIFLLVVRTTMYFLDDHDALRDARAVADADAWLRANPVPVRQLVWSQTYMCIILRCDTRHRVMLSNDRAHDIAVLAATPPGTLIFWDGKTGPDWYGLGAPDFRAAGFHELFDRRYELKPRFEKRFWYSYGPWTRSQEMLLYYKGDSASSGSPSPGAH